MQPRFACGSRRTAPSLASMTVAQNKRNPNKARHHYLRPRGRGLRRVRADVRMRKIMTRRQIGLTAGTTWSLFVTLFLLWGMVGTYAEIHSRATAVLQIPDWVSPILLFTLFVGCPLGLVISPIMICMWRRHLGAGKSRSAMILVNIIGTIAAAVGVVWVVVLLAHPFPNPR